MEAACHCGVKAAHTACETSASPRAGMSKTLSSLQAAQAVLGCWLAAAAALSIALAVVPLDCKPLWGWLLFFEWTAASFCLLEGLQLQHCLAAGALERTRAPPWQARRRVRVCKAAHFMHSCSGTSKP